MNILGHITVGLCGYAITQEPLFFIGSLLPDVALIPNELSHRKFDKWNIKFKWLYEISHSLYLPLILALVDNSLSFAYLLHLVIDIPFHTSSLRWKPFLFNRYKSKKKVLLLSGGADSIACAELERNYDCIFFHYGQRYAEQELACAIEYCNKQNLYLNIIHVAWAHDIPNRNYYMIAECIRLGYDEVIIGTRNVLPIFDKYKDSNWFSLKLYQHLMRVYINMPVIGNFKFQIIKKTNRHKFYSTENL